ncbi:MAG: hypothetical protein ACRDHK_11605, partial [Actinomycetota bacterium]
MSRRRAGWLGVGAGAVVLSLVVGVLWSLRSPGVRAGSPGAGAGAERARFAEPPGYELTVDLRRVQGRGPSGTAPPWRLATSAEGIRRTMTELYSVGFVDPHLWAEGSFPTLPELFAADARSEALRRVGDLTLGRAALHLDAVQPMRAR